MKKVLYSVLTLLLIVSVFSPSIVLADKLKVDNDIYTPGVQHQVNLTAAPGATVNTHAQIVIERSGKNNLSVGNPVNFVVDTGETTLPAGYSVSPVSGAIPSPWDTNGLEYAVGWSDISFTAPTIPGNYTYHVRWESTIDYGNKLTGAPQPFLIKLRVEGGTPPPETAEIIFYQTGVGSDFTGVVLTVGGIDYGVTDLPVTITENVGEEIDFEYYSPLVVDAGKRYVWTETTGLTTDQSSTLVVPSGGGTVTGNYKTQYYLTVNTNPAEVLTLNPAAVSGSGWYDSGAIATVDAIQNVTKATGERYDFRSWTGVTATGAGNEATVLMDGPKTATANYQLQYYLTLVSNPSGIGTQTGADWYDANTWANISTTNPAGSYYFSGWTTDDMAEITNPYALSTTVLMDKAKTVTANYRLSIAPTGGKTIGFWSNKNGQALLTLDDADFLNGLPPYATFTPYPKEPAGSTPFSTTSLATFKKQVNGYLLNANAVDMRYMLAAQLLATELSVKKGFLTGSQEVWVDDGDLIVEPGEAMTIASIMSEAIAKWSSGTRAEREYLKNLLDKINNNQLLFLGP